MEPTPDHGSHMPGGAHRQAGLDEELSADGLDLTPDRDEIAVPGVTTNEVLLERSELAIFLRPSVFPASAASLVQTARDEHAPPEILARLEKLPSSTYHTVQEVWEALGGASERRDAPPSGELMPTQTPDAQDEDPASSPVPTTPSWVDGVARLAGRWTETTVRVLLGGTVAVVSHATRQVTRRSP